MSTKTTAETIADRFDNDGTTWHERHTGVAIDDACAEAEAAYHEAGGFQRYEFRDGSAIVLGPGSWDVGITNPSPAETFRCTCWAGADQGRHHEDCPAAPVETITDEEGKEVEVSR